MLYRNEKHKAVFENAIRKKDIRSTSLMGAIYLLTSDFKIWQILKHHINKNKINFKQVRLSGIGEEAYTLYCTAKDLYLGTKHLTIRDLADTDLISPKMFSVICNAMAIRRYGLETVRIQDNNY